MATHHFDVVVVGGGAMGSAAAWHLARRGVDVALLDRYEPGNRYGASHGASRMFRTSYPEPEYITLAREAERQWRELEDVSGTDILTTTGGIDHGPYPRLRELSEALTAGGVAHSWIPLEEARTRWPGIRFDEHVLFHPDSGRVHADRAVVALQDAARKDGAAIHLRTRVRSIGVHPDGTVEVQTDDDVFRARRVVSAVGAWTQKMVGHLVPLPELTVTQEQPAHFAPFIADEQWPAFVHTFAPDSPERRRFHGGVYGMLTPGEGIKFGFHGVGPVVDPDHRDFAVEPIEMGNLKAYVERWIPGANADVFEPISCTYTTTTDSNFVLDRHGPIVVAAGFSGHGFKFTPAIGRVLADLALNTQPTDRLFAFRR